MKLNQLPKLKMRSKKRVGRGIGSGKGKTAGRGAKGQKKRGKVALNFSGGGLPLYKKIPFLRGIKNKPVSPKSIPVKLERLNLFRANSIVDLSSLIEKKIINERQAKKSGVKILGNGKLNIPLTIKLPVSKKAKDMIEKMGGKVV